MPFCGDFPCEDEEGKAQAPNPVSRVVAVGTTLQPTIPEHPTELHNNHHSAYPFFTWKEDHPESRFHVASVVTVYRLQMRFLKALTLTPKKEERARAGIRY